MSDLLFGKAKRLLFAAGLLTVCLITGPCDLAAQTVTFDGSTTITIPNVKVGTTINVQAILTTNDPDENGEGEPLVITSSGGFSFVMPDYFAPQSFSFKATQAGETLTATIVGADGDESATITVTTNRPTRFTPEQKAALAKAIADLRLHAAAGGVVALGCLLVPDPTITKACAIGAGAYGAFTGLSSAVLGSILARDPNDPNFTVVAQPVFFLLPPVQVQPGVTQAEADAMNALFTEEAQALGLERAILIAIDRANSAFAAGDSASETLQLNAAAQFAEQLAPLFNSDNALRANLVTAIQNSGFAGFQITPSDVFNFEVQTAFFGLNPNVLQLLNQLGASPDEIFLVTGSLIVQDPNLVPTSFPAFLVDPNLNASVTSIATVFQQFADNILGKPLTPGQRVQAQGSISDPKSGFVTFAVEADVGGNPPALRGKLELNAHDAGFSIQHSTITSARILGTNGTAIDGTYQASDGTSGTFHIVAVDNSKPGNGSDTFSVTLSNGFHASGTLTGGNVEVPLASQ